MSNCFEAYRSCNKKCSGKLTRFQKIILVCRNFRKFKDMSGREIILSSVGETDIPARTG